MSQSQNNGTIELICDQVREMTVDTLIKHLNLVVDGHRYSTQGIWNVTVAASAQCQAIESAAKKLEDAPASSTVRFHIRNGLVNVTTLGSLEDSLNACLVSQLPPGICGKWHKVAMDLTLIPYHGQAAVSSSEIRRGKAKLGTTHFHCYAIAYVIKKNKCITLAFTYAQYEARDGIWTFIDYYNHRRPHQSLNYVIPYDVLVGRAEEVIQQRRKKHIIAQQRRKERRKEINKRMVG